MGKVPPGLELLVRMILHGRDRTLGAQNPIPKGIGGSSSVM